LNDFKDYIVIRNLAFYIRTQKDYNCYRILLSSTTKNIEKKQLNIFEVIAHY
jgi:hypothetical protein